MGNTISTFQKGYDQGFNIPTPPLTEKNLPDQDGKVFIVTGSNIGVGYELASILYSRHATVYIAARTESKALDAISAIKSAHPPSRGQLHYLHLDLSDFSGIKTSAETFLSRESRLDWLCNNAGVMVPPPGSRSTQDQDLQYATNVLGPFLFTKLLLPILSKTAESAPAGSVRVSWAGSFGIETFSPKGGMHFEADGETPKDFGGTVMTYGSSKVANLWLAHEFGARYGSRDGVLHTCFNPGNLNSNLQVHAKARYGALPLRIMASLMLYPPVFGAYTELYTGLSPELTMQDQGAYVVPWGRKRTNVREDVVKEMGEGKASEKLWAWCEKVTGPYA